MRRGNRLSSVALPAAVAAVLLLLGLLATLQYRWAGELSEAERLRLRAAAQARADALSRDFDVEVTRAFVKLQMSGRSLRDGADYADVYDAWRRGAADPSLVRDVFLVELADEEGAALRLSRFVLAKRTFEPAEWSPTLEAIRRWGEGLPARLGSGPFPHRLPRDHRIVEDVPALALPVFELDEDRDWRGPADHHGPRPRPTAFLLVVLAPDSLLASLAERHFGSADGLDYELAVVSSQDQGVRWRSRPQASLDRPDASASLLDLRFEEMGEWERRGFPRRMPPRDGHGRWRLLVSHRAGPLDGVVAAARRRNLAVSFGILALLGASMTLVVASAVRARRLGQKQMDFVAAVSHELRTPLAVICSSAENLADGVVAEPKEVRVYGSLLRDQGRRLGRMVEQVLEFAGSSAARTVPRTEEVDVCRLLDDALQPFEDRLRDEGFAVEKEAEPGLPPVRGDAHALSHALQNLVENALKYDAGARWLALRANRAGGGTEVRITVEDRGTGIAPADLSHVFEPFFRGGAARETGVRGFGLGLALVRRVVEDHRGRVDVASTPGHGTTFAIVLPAAQAEETRADEAADALPHPSR
jgi:signal transduction histidine kinase